MKVYLDEDGTPRLIGRADLPPDHGLVFEVPLFGPSSVIGERFTIGSVTHLAPRAEPAVERAVLLV